MRFFHNWTRQTYRSWRSLPEVATQRCIRSLSLAVSCTDCSDLCPQDAIVQGAGGPYVNPDACTACGLCQGGCPASTISVFDLLPAGQGVAVFQCRESGAGSSDRGTLAGCAHAIDVPLLAALYVDDIHTLEIHTGSCGDCIYQRGMRFEETLEAFNRLVADRGLPEMQLRTNSPRVSRCNRLAGHDIPRSVDRRGLLFARADEVFGDRVTGRDRLEKLRFLLEQGQDSINSPRLHRFVPEIQVDRCVGCDVCTHTCPEQAVQLASIRQDCWAYRISPERCTGCGVCVSLCDHDAIQVYPLVKGEAIDYPLVFRQCIRCGMTYHTPIDMSSVAPGDALGIASKVAPGSDDPAQASESVCPHCESSDRRPSLFQVFE